MLSKRTDLALETRESFPGDGGEIEGVILEKKDIDISDNLCLEISTVKIINEAGAHRMKKPVGTYITIEFGDVLRIDGNDRELVIENIGRLIEELTGKIVDLRVMVAGLGNRQVTADSLGPLTVDNLNISRHLALEYGHSFLDSLGIGEMCAIAPGVMAQTGMEAEEVLSAIADEIKPDLIIVIDALAARSVKRVTTTLQITDTGIKPGSGVGNHRVGVDMKSLGVPVIAIGVPTVVEAEVIVSDRIEDFMGRQGFDENEIQLFINNMGEPSISDMYVTPKNIDETVGLVGKMIADVINYMMSFTEGAGE